MENLQIGDDVFNITLNRMGSVRGVDNGMVCVRSSHGLEHWKISECEKTNFNEFEE